MPLVLNRRVGETVVIDDAKIKVTVIGIDNGSARLAIEAPRDITIDRQEIHERKLGGNHARNGNC